ncbi:MAG: MFS transporter [Sneathiella sp.]
MTYSTNTASSGSSEGSPSSYQDSSYSWFRLFVSVLLATIGSVGMWSIIVVMPQIEREFGIDRADASLPFTTIMISFGLGNLIVGRLVDRFGIAVPLFCSILLIVSGFFLSTLTTNILSFAAVQGILVGFGTSALFGPLMSDISHWFDKRLGIAIAAAASGNYFAGSLWPLFLKDTVTEDGWREAYSLIAIILLFTMPPLAMMLRKKRPSEADAIVQTASRRETSGQSINLTPRMLQGLMIVAGIACCVAMAMPQVHIVAYCADLGYGIARGAEMLSLMLAGGIISRLASGYIADYIGGIRTLLLGSLFQGIALCLYVPFDGLVSLYIVSFVFGLSQGGIVPGYAIIIREYLPAKEAGQRVGLVILATVIGMAVGGWLSGLIFDLTKSYQAAFLNGIAWNAVNFLIIAFLLWRTRTQQPALAA